MTHVSANLEAVYDLFGHRLRAARLRKGLTVAELARQVGRTVSSLRIIELGQQRIPLHLAAELAAAVGADLGEMVRQSHKRARWDALGE